MLNTTWTVEQTSPDHYHAHSERFGHTFDADSYEDLISGIREISAEHLESEQDRDDTKRVLDVR